MITKRTVIGAHAFFFRDGLAFTIPAAGTCGRSSKPGPTDTGWLDLGVSDWGIATDNKSEPFMAPSPGARVLYDKITTSKGIKLKGKLMEMSNLIFQMLLGTLALPNSPTAGGQYNPMEGDPLVRGWIKLQQYGIDNALINTMDVYVAMSIQGDLKFDDKPIDADVEAEVLFSTLNTGTLV